MKTTIVVPAYNEEKTIRNIIKSVRPYGDEVLVALAKRSTDKTREIVEKIKNVKLVVDNGKGKGDGMRVAIDYSDADILVFIDSDGSHIPKDIPKLVKPIKEGKADMVIASRFLGGSEELHGDFAKFMRMFFSMCIAQIMNWRFGASIMDTQNGFRAIKGDVAKDLKLTSNHTEVETEMDMKCFKKGYKIMEVPSMELGRKHGGSSINLWKHGWKYIWIVVKNIF